ncbi:hypothetical protein LC593_22995, partial [Nostoc sp. CHAB 5844]|nr:hypothetical protein [Nostoc sp. CHAB 5844]
AFKLYSFHGSVPDRSALQRSLRHLSNLSHFLTRVNYFLKEFFSSLSNALLIGFVVHNSECTMLI